MNITVLSNNGYTPVDVLENYQIDSVIWVDRYNKEGEFEIYAKFSYELLSLLQQGYYLLSSDSDHMMVIETIEVRTNPETGNKIIIRGRSIESLLDRRIILEQTLINSSLQSGIQTILNNEVISSRFAERNYPYFSFSVSTDPAVTGPSLMAQFYSENVLDVVKTLCQQANLGFKIIVNASNYMVFSLYAGKDRSYEQTTYPYVVFSPSFENLISSEYFSSIKGKKNFALIKGDPMVPTGPSYNNQIWTSDVGTGLNRLEMFVDASDLAKEYQDTTNQIPDATYYNQLKQRGWMELLQWVDITAFDGQVDLRNTYKYRVDFDLGDIVQLIDAFGNNETVRVTEVTISENVNTGYSVYPTLETV